MTTMLTAEDLAVRAARAATAAAAAGRDLGLAVAEPRVLYDMFSVIVHLVPTSVV
ncbi:MAG: aminoglycoside phosphotransferase family protein, partial [Actinomycetota bacterium]|nr:aminoglycoside phosphotransferase family protein [Actinomycetota bacterium]